MVNYAPVYVSVQRMRTGAGVAAGVGICPARGALEKPASLKVLFLGDNGHHRPAERFRQLQPVLAARGIDLTYTDKVDALDPEDARTATTACIVYANIDQDHAGAGEGPARLRRRRQGVRPAPLRVVLLPQLAEVHRAGRRPVPAARHRHVPHDRRRSRTTRS